MKLRRKIVEMIASLTALAIGAFLIGLLTGCAHVQQGRHIATVSVVSAHAVLSAVQDGEALLVCGAPSAPAAPRCVSPDAHRQVAGKLATAFGLDEQVARAVRAVPPGAPTPSEVTSLLSQVTSLLDEIFALVPESSQKAALATKVGGGE